MNKGKELKPHIGIFGRRNSGKSSIINVLTGQNTAIVSEIAGTTTDPVKKSLEIESVGASVLIDTAGIDDEGDVGLKRIEKTLQTTDFINAALLIISENNFGSPEEELIKLFDAKQIPFLIVHNKEDKETLNTSISELINSKYHTEIILFSAIHPKNMEQLLRAIQKIIPETVYQRKSLLGEIIKKDDVVLLVAPQDTEAPEGRLILPQVQLIRDIIDNNAVAIITKVDEAEIFIKKTIPQPALVITDSQAFYKVKDFVPKEIPLTSFSIVLASQHKLFQEYIKGTPTISTLKDGDCVLILESCTHHVTCDDIGRNKIPTWMRKFTGKNLEFDIVAGTGIIPRPLVDYALVLQCGGCVLTQQQLYNRVSPVAKLNIPISNYGMAIAFMQGIFDRVLQPFKNIKTL
jgi:[FeFe] hydrogenase H-cluster maturation GTPase HydF